MEAVTEALLKMGFKTIGRVRHKNANGPDLHVIRDERLFTVEIKKARKHSRRDTLSVHPVEPARRKDDIIAIVFPSGYVLIEPMKDHLAACPKSGYRSLGPLS